MSLRGDRGEMRDTWGSQLSPFRPISWHTDQMLRLKAKTSQNNQYCDKCAEVGWKRFSHITGQVWVLSVWPSWGGAWHVPLVLMLQTDIYVPPKNTINQFWSAKWTGQMDLWVHGNMGHINNNIKSRTRQLVYTEVQKVTVTQGPISNLSFYGGRAPSSFCFTVNESIRNPLVSI